MKVQSRSLASALCAVLIAGAANAGPASGAQSDTTPQLRMVAASKSVTLEKWPGEGVLLDLGTHIVAGKNPFEIWVKRNSYNDPIVATQKTRRNKHVELPDGLVTRFSGFKAFTHVTIKNAQGKKVVNRNFNYCPNNYGAVRYQPDAPGTSPYPEYCPTWNTRFTLGSVWGIQKGWASPMLDDENSPYVPLKVGKYTATVTINKAYREAFDIPAEHAKVKLRIKVVKGQGCDDHGCEEAPTTHSQTPGPELEPADQRPSDKPSVPKHGMKPDLRAHPAFDITTSKRGKRDYLRFAATAWVAGDSPLVVDGFRRSGEDTMDAYQYFYDRKGREVGHAPVGTMEWDARDGHTHWHFTDFAQYRLWNSSKTKAVRSGKEAFCLANTDAVDYTLPRAEWRPDNTDLHTACGGQNSLAVREVLSIGNGDTYTQSTPGQAFNITKVPNGTYYIEVAANPDRRLYESDKSNNVSYRKVILGGKPGERTVEVPPYQP